MEYIKQFLSIQQQIRIYHWTSKIYNQHVITGQLYEKLDEKIDKFIEIFSSHHTINVSKLSIRSVVLTRDGLLKRLNEFIEFLKGLSEGLSEGLSTDLLNIRDEILAEVHQHIYLLKMD